MEILLHIGQSKTGTSAIQGFMTLNRQALEAAGILYPSVRVAGSTVDLGSHNALADAIEGLRPYPYLSAAEYSKQFFEQTDTANISRMIISGEHFFNGAPRVSSIENEAVYLKKYRRKVDRVAEFFSGHKLKILVYLRPQVEWIESAIGHHIKVQGLLERDAYFKTDEEYLNRSLPLLKYATRLGMWSEAFPDAEIVAVPYVRSTLKNGDAISDFLYQADIDPAKYSLGTTHLSVNDSISREYVEVKRRLNIEKRSSANERAVIECLTKLSRNSKDRYRYTVSAEIVEKIKNICDLENEIVNAEYVKTGAKLESTEPARQVPPTLSQAEIESAFALYEKEFSRPYYRMSELKQQLKAFIRVRARPLHGILHQLKRHRRAAQYRSS